MHTHERFLNYFIPTKYALTINLENAKKHEFNGHVSISGRMLNANIYLHAKDLNINKISIDGKNMPWKYINSGISLDLSVLPIGEIKIDVDFSGNINDAMHGLYPCYYNLDGEKHEIYATQFESHHAREVFPCIDEPAAKAEFDLTLITDKGISVLGNTPVKEQVERDATLYTSFETTPRMSTYLLAFVVGKMHSVTMKSKTGTETTIYASLAQPKESMEFALDMAMRVIDFYTDYFKVDYPLSKIDHVALPDFSSGAMENWGLITYRESALIVDKYASLDTKTHVAMVIAHELAHQWFGNLVTMEWWDDLWLNESFANYMEYVAIDALKPEWNVWLEFTGEIIAALRRDCFDNVQPVRIEVSDPDEIGALFDGAIVYAKGARLLRMLITYIGEEAFKKSLKIYFDRHAYQNTKDNDLWQAMSEASGKDVATFMHKWLNTPGYPVVSVSRHDNETSLAQERFFIGSHVKSDQTWPILLDTNLDNAPEVFDDSSIKFQTSDSMLLLNKQNAVHFITNYDETSRQQIVNKVKEQTLTDSQMLQFLNEQTLIVRGGKLPSVELFDILPAYKNAEPHPIWDVIAMASGDLKRFVENADELLQSKLKSYLLDISQNQYNRLGNSYIENESTNDTQLRSTILSFRLYGEDSKFIDYALDSYEKIGLENLNPEAIEIILMANVKYSKKINMTSNLIAKYDETSSSELKYNLLHALSSSNDPNTHNLLLSRLRDPSKVKPQDVVIWIVNLLANPKSRQTTWRWINDNWAWIDDTFSGDKSIDDYPRYSSRYLSTTKELAEYRALFEPLLSDPALARAITIGINEIDARQKLLERDSTAVFEYLLNL